MISNRCARKSLVTNCNSIISKNYLRLLVDSNEILYKKSPSILPFLGKVRGSMKKDNDDSL